MDLRHEQVDDGEPDIHALMTASSYLMTRYTVCASRDMAQGVVDHLKMLLAHSEIQSSSSSVETYSGLLHEWVRILMRHQNHECPCCNKDKTH